MPKTFRLKPSCKCQNVKISKKGQRRNVTGINSACFLGDPIPVKQIKKINK